MLCPCLCRVRVRVRTLSEILSEVCGEASLSLQGLEGEREVCKVHCNIQLYAIPSNISGCDLASGALTW